jgi:hypothetical protein
MIFSFTTQGREGVGTADYGLCAATTGNALVPSVVNTYRGGFRPVPAVMPPSAVASPGWRSQTVGSCFTALPAFFFRDCCGLRGFNRVLTPAASHPFAVYAGQCRHGTISGFGPSVLGCGYMAASRLPLWKRFLPRLGGAGFGRPAPFHSFKSLALKLCNQPRDLFVKSRERFCVSSFQNIPLASVQFTLGKFQWKRKSLPKIPVTA